MKRFQTKGGENSNMSKMPVLFIGHGSPMNLVEENMYTRSMQELSAKLPKPEAICVVSAHWQTEGTRICCNAYPRQIYDFYNFPKALYEIIYEPDGAPELAVQAAKLLGGEESGPRCNNVAKGDNDWGNDHAAWMVLYHLFPRGEIPTFYISVDMSSPGESLVELGKKLRPLRSKGVLIVGSGNIVHNLYDVDWENAAAAPAKDGYEFDESIKAALVSNNLPDIINYKKLPGAQYSVPTPDHFLPLLWVAGVREESDTITFPCEGFLNRSVSMRSVLISST